MTKIFITGATGYIGGDALYEIAQAHPEYDITVLVRDTTKGALVAAQYPSVKLVYGSLDDLDLLREQAAAADIVLQCADADHKAGVEAIVAGLGTKDKAKPGFLIHTSGTGILAWEDVKEWKFGFEREKVYDDWDGLGEVTSLPDDAIHRNVDKVVLAAGDQGVKSAVVCPPCINGVGRGPGNQRSIQMYDLTKNILKFGYGFKVGEGKNHWTAINVHDLSRVFLRLVEEAVKGGGSASWGPEGYYFTENGDFVWADVSKAIAKEAKKRGLIQSDEIRSITPEEADAARQWGAFGWGSNSRGKAIRANKVLGWVPKERSIFDEIPDVVDAEARALGLIQGHAAKAAGDA